VSPAGKAVAASLPGCALCVGLAGRRRGGSGAGPGELVACGRLCSACRSGCLEQARGVWAVAVPLGETAPVAGLPAVPLPVPGWVDRGEFPEVMSALIGRASEVVALTTGLVGAGRSS
jgi:hypothetical protein